MTTILLIRHGETVGNREGLFRGQRDFPLNEHGMRQTKALVQELSCWRIDAIYSSPLSRATETARPLAEPRGLPVIQEAGFLDLHFGDWEGRSKEEVAQEEPELWKLWMSQPERLAREGTETLAQVQRRAYLALERIVQEQAGKTIAVVSHRAVLKALIARCLGIPEPYFWKIHLDTASYSLLEQSVERGYALTLLNQTRHLQDFIREVA